MTLPPVAIFWDYENCTPQIGVGFAVVDNIQQIAHRYGSVKLFKAYLELSDQNQAKALALRSELQSCGVSLTDCPHNGRKDVADKMMLVDMLAYAIDTPAPATVIVISGDRDFVYAVSTLRLRQYQVVVIAPQTAHSSLRARASENYDWDCDVLGRAPPTTPRDTSSGARGWSDPDGPVSRPGHNPTPSSGASVKLNYRMRRESVTYGTLNFNDSKPSRPDASAQGGNAYGTGKHPIPPPFTFPATPVSERRPTIRSSPAERRTFAGTSTRPDSTSPAYTSWRGLSVTPSLGSGLLPPISPAAQQTPLEPSAELAPDFPKNTRTSSSSTDAVGQSVPVPLHGGSIPINNPIGDAGGSVSSRLDDEVNQPVPSGALNPTVPAFASTPSSSSSGPPLEPLASDDTTADVFATNTDDDRVRDPLPTRPLERLVIPALRSAVDVDPDAQTQVAGPSHEEAIVTTIEPPSPEVDPAAFDHLVDILQWEHAHGRATILRSALAIQLKQRNAHVYQLAGVRTFKEYAAIAEHLGIVVLGGSQGGAWIALTSSALNS